MSLISNLKVSSISLCLSMVRPDERLVLDLKKVLCFFKILLVTSPYNDFSKIFYSNHIMPSFLVLVSLVYPSISKFSITGEN